MGVHAKRGQTMKGHLPPALRLGALAGLPLRSCHKIQEIKVHYDDGDVVVTSPPECFLHQELACRSRVGDMAPAQQIDGILVTQKIP
jgi:hypothetical protein